MSWQRVGRWILAVTGVGMAVFLYVSTHHRPSQITAPPIPATADLAASIQSGEGTQVQTVNDLERYRITYQGQKVYPDKHIEWEKVTITFKEDGTEVSADAARVIGPPKGTQAPSSLALTGHVHLRTSEGATVEGESATYEDATGVTDIPGPVTFTRGRMSGSGMGATFERSTGVFHLLAQAHMTTVADPTHPDPVDATADTLVFNRATKAMQFDTHARIAHGPDVMTGDRATLYLSEDEQQFRVIELRGNSHVAPEPGKTSDTPDMHADDIDLGFYEGTQVLQHAVLRQNAVMVLVNADGRRSVSGGGIIFDTANDGKTLTALNATDHVVVDTPASKDVPQREIKAPSLVSAGDPKVGLTSATFSGGVTFTETIRGAAGKAATARTGTAQVLTLKLKGQLDAIDEAEFQRDVVFKDGDVTGNADIGTYLASQGKLVLKPDPNPRAAKRPVVKNGDMTVDAHDEIHVDLASHDVSAAGDVKTISAASSDSSRGSALFNGTDKVYGFASQFEYVSAGGKTTYVGTVAAPAVVKQGTQWVKGVRVVIVNDTQDLTATGSVESVFLLADDSSPKPVQYTMTGAGMVYNDAKRLLTYAGKPAVMKAPDSGSEGETIELTLAKEGRTVEKLEVRGDGHSRLSGGREVLADQITYEQSSGQYTFTGKVVLRVKDSTGKCTQTTAPLGYLLKGQDAPTFPTGRAPVDTHEVACGPLKR